MIFRLIRIEALRSIEMIKFQEYKPYELFQLVSWLLLIKSIELQKYLAINYYAIKRVNFSKLVIVFVFLYNKVRY